MNGVEVLIVGAGPTGLTLACELARRHVSHRVVEKSQFLFVGSRAKGLQPRTLEVFEDLGVLDAVRRDGMPFPPFRMYAGNKLVWQRSLEEMLRLPPSEASPSVPHPRAWLIPQWRTDRILYARLQSLGGRVEFGTELCALSQGADSVLATVVRRGATERIMARYVVGADGGRSFVRKSCGFTFEGRNDASETTLLADVRASGMDTSATRGPACHLFTREGNPGERISLWDLPSSEYFQLVATLPAAEVPELSVDAVQNLFELRSGRDDIALQELRWVSLYQVKVRMVERFRHARVLLAGDAAHIHSPAGGQGLNTGVQDAYNLGWKLAAALRDPRAERLLDTYTEERLPVAVRVLGLTSKLDANRFRVDGSQGPPALDQLDISYAGGTLALDDGVPSALRAGARAPDARLTDGSRLFEHLRGPDFTLLAFGEALSSSAMAGVRIAGVQVVRVHDPLPSYGVERGYVLVRPDGHVGAISASLAAIEGYLESWGCAGARG